MTLQQKTIAVLVGGWNHEREVSCSTGQNIYTALREAGYSAHMIDVHYDIRQLIADIDRVKPDIILNALHGEGCEDGVIQGVLQMLGIPYTHSDVVASAIAMDKIKSRLVFQSVGIPVPIYQVHDFQEYGQSSHHPFAFPYITKPLNSGSSCGVSLITSDADKQRMMAEWDFGPMVLCEDYIPGREIQVAVMRGKAIGAIELQPHSGLYDYEAKYTENKTIHLMPASLDAADEALVYAYAERAHHVLGCAGVTRADFRLDPSKTGLDRIRLLEINTQPGMTNLSLVPEIAAHYGIKFIEILEFLLEDAVQTAEQRAISGHGFRQSLQMADRRSA